MSHIVKLMFIAVLVLEYAADAEGHCAHCTPEEYCHNTFWIFSRCIRYRVEGDICDKRHRICDLTLKCRRGTCQSKFGRSKRVSKTASSTEQISETTTTTPAIVTTTTTNPSTSSIFENAVFKTSIFVTDTSPKAETFSDGQMSQITTTTEMVTTSSNPTTTSNPSTSSIFEEALSTTSIFVAHTSPKAETLSDGQMSQTPTSMEMVATTSSSNPTTTSNPSTSSNFGDSQPTTTIFVADT